MKAVIYARVSSKEQEREGYSIPAQLEACRTLAGKRGYRVIQEFIDVESAKEAGRTNFGKMVDYIRKDGVEVIVCHKVDRLCRNFRDFVTVDDLEASPIFVEEEFPDNASGKLTYGLKVLLAKHYIDNLSDEVKKGMRQKIARGEWPHLAPYGYRNSGPGRTLQIEPTEAANVLYMYRTFATGDFSLQALRKKFREDGLVYKSRSRVPAKGQLENMLKNPIYFGIMRIKGKEYPGSHEPIVSKELFDKVQDVFRAANKPKMTKRTFIYGGMITCALCGCAVTAEIKKGRYVYYHCTGNRDGCDIQYIREEELVLQFDRVAERLNISGEFYDMISQSLQASTQDEVEFNRKVEARLSKRRETLRKRIDQAYVDKLDGIIGEELWQQKSSQWEKELTDVDRQISALGTSGLCCMLQGTRIIELARNAYPWYLEEDSTQKRKLLQILASNYLLDGRNLHYSYKKPFDILVKGLDRQEWLGWLDSNQRYRLQRPVYYHFSLILPG